MLKISVRVTGLDLFPGRPEVREAIKTALRSATRQDGALTTVQATDAGLTQSQIRALVGNGGDRDDRLGCRGGGHWFRRRLGQKLS